MCKYPKENTSLRGSHLNFLRGSRNFSKVTKYLQTVFLEHPDGCQAADHKLRNAQIFSPRTILMSGRVTLSVISCCHPRRFIKVKSTASLSKEQQSMLTIYMPNLQQLIFVQEAYMVYFFPDSSDKFWKPSGIMIWKMYFPHGAVIFF